MTINRRPHLTTLAQILWDDKEPTYCVVVYFSWGKELLRSPVRAVKVTLEGLASLSKYIKLRKHPPEQLWPFPL